MAISIPGLSLSILRQQTAVQAGLPLLISGRFTAFGLGVPTYIRVFLEGPSYDPQLRSFDTFASPFSGDYSTNVLAEKDGRYNVYAQAFPPPLIPTGPLFPEAIMLLPPMAESTHPPLVVGFPFNGGVDALLPDGTRQRLPAPPMQPIEFRPIITVAPGITVIAPGVPAYPRIPLPAPPPAPPPAAPPAPPEVTRAAIDDIRFSPEEINPGMEATGIMTWRNTGDAPQLFDTVFYLVSPVGVRYGPLQVNQEVSAHPQVPATQNLRLSTEGMPSGVYSVVGEIYDVTTGALIAARTLPSRLQIMEIAPPVVPPPPPPPVVPEVPTIDILGTPSLNLPSQLNVGDVWSGSVNLPTFGTVPYFVEAHLLLRDPTGVEYVVAQGGRTLSPGETLQVPVNYDTSGFTGGYYTILMRVFDQIGNQIAEFPMGFLSMIEAVAPPVLPPPVVPEIPEAPTLPTADMFGTPSVNLPTEVEIGELWSGNISIPTQVPFALQALPSLPSYPVNAGLQLQSPIGQLFNVATFQRTFIPGQPITLPVNFDTSVLPQEGIHNLILNISDIQGNTLFSNVIGTLRALEVPVPPPPEVPAPPPELPRADIANWNFVITSAGPFDTGDSVFWQASGVYKGRAQPGSLVITLGVGVAPAFLARFTLPAIPVNFEESRDWVPFNLSGQFTIPAGVERGQTYTVQARISSTIEAAQETDRDFGAITITAAPAPPPVLPRADIADFNFRILTTAFDLGDIIPWVATGKYRGRAQGGRLTISLGTGPLGTFFTKFTLPPNSVDFNEAFDWQDFSFSGSFAIPANVAPGQTYSVRARLEALLEPTQETDTDWGVITITAPPAVGPSEFSNVQISPVDRYGTRGLTMAIQVNYTHVGQGESEWLYAAIGNRGVFGFNEILSGQKAITVPDDPSPVQRYEFIEIPITSAISPGTYDLYAKVGIGLRPKAISPTYNNVVHIDGFEPF